ncbi:hypothetical protein H6G54_11965 [Anabaena cylindrica FACHB-243]|uniref:Flagellar assembly protein H n=1 Tax=Anabaena cylindrica (strain ATCC 27899 / PCC 7122) TaxID=272123 RepID=K9ZEY8_ANACC|nr:MULTISPECIES: hypothetical protein [Anabaena]AFZ56935.1 hypothetical protein Anacy_1424 [Anabaena cylindrica PCC 7122]MBD2418399.1 hypothetical protein [Anabaena cylindrica FACHB-243]MBY5284346.1 hypothetical protein [Anabaena sp. CCAP 1446/1C]MBY5307621.1 hypothetical protein [Anabaena sp. CCAP 1446/1C]MCM2409418.1 hypothetical protein [Anabaena sp. CCAP 1446/1C]
MTRQSHDQFAKEYLEELLTPLGTIKKSEKVKSEVQEIDVWFEPSPIPPQENLPLGLLGKMAKTQCLFEPFRNPPSEIEFRSCLLKLYAVHGDVVRKAKRENRNIAESELPILWILIPTFSSRMITGLGATEITEDWVQGVYFLPNILTTAIVVIHQLPEKEDTLWLRVLGKGGTQKRAVEELTKLPENNPFRENLLEILADWRKNLELRDNLSREEEEVIMNLSPAYLQQIEDWKQEGQVYLITSLLEGRFGSLDAELSGLVEKIANIPISERTQLLLSLGNLSREELLQRLSNEAV